jgi:organic hydroperoxide reductase OsmC/OhrA
MNLFPHRHHVHVTAAADGYAQASTSGAPPLTAAPAPQFGGPGDAWTPEHLLLAALETSFVFTCRAFAHRANIPAQSIDVEAAGTVHRMMGVARFVEIVLRPTIRIDGSVSRDVVTQLLSDAANASIITASLSTPVRVEPVVLEAGKALQPVSHAA